MQLMTIRYLLSSTLPLNPARTAGLERMIRKVYGERSVYGTTFRRERHLEQVPVAIKLLRSPPS